MYYYFHFNTLGLLTVLVVTRFVLCLLLLCGIPYRLLAMEVINIAEDLYFETIYKAKGEVWVCDSISNENRKMHRQCRHNVVRTDCDQSPTRLRLMRHYFWNQFLNY